jgi:hypothetical protein
MPVTCSWTREVEQGVHSTEDCSGGFRGKRLGTLRLCVSGMRPRVQAQLRKKNSSMFVLGVVRITVIKDKGFCCPWHWEAAAMYSKRDVSLECRGIVPKEDVQNAKLFRVGRGLFDKGK